MDGIGLPANAALTRLTPAALDGAAARKSDDPKRIHDAAQQFEALLLGQILRSAHTEGGWLGSGEDQSGGCATDFAEQQFATMLAQSGGLGLAGMITAGLQAKPAAESAPPATPRAGAPTAPPAAAE